MRKSRTRGLSRKRSEGEGVLGCKEIDWFSLGIQYHVTARYSACAGLLPVTGNLFHHAIEMYLKGYLSSKLGVTALKKFRHGLRKIWSRFKLEVADPSLSHFDSVISELDKFEAIRYPDRILSEGMQVSFTFAKRNTTAKNLNPNRKEPIYELYIEEIDKLVKVIFEKAGINPKFFTAQVGPDGSKFLNKWNNSPLK